MLELSLPFLASVVVTILLRRMDKSNVNLRKLKTLIERGQKELVEIAQRKKEELQDTGAQLDLMLINSQKHLTSLKEELETLRTSMSDVQESRSNLLQMDGELQSLEATTSTVKDQLKYINESLGKIDYHQKKIKNLQDYIKSVDKDAARMVKTFQESLDERFEEAARLMDTRFEKVSGESGEYQNKLRDELLERHSILANKVNENYRELETSLRESARGATSALEKEVHSRFSSLDELDHKMQEQEKTLKTGIPRLIEELKERFSQNLAGNNSELSEIKERFVQIEGEIHKKIELFYHELENKRSAQLAGFEQHVGEIREQIQGLDLDAVAKKDDIIRSVKEEALRIRSSTESFHDTYNSARENILEFVEAKESDLTDLAKKYENELQGMIGEMGDAAGVKKEELTELLHEEFASIQKKMHGIGDVVEEVEIRLDQKVKLADEMGRKLEESLQGSIDKAVEELNLQTRQSRDEIIESAHREFDQLHTKVISLQEYATLVETNIEEKIAFAEGKVESFNESLKENLERVIGEQTRKAGDEGERILGLIRNEFDRVQDKVTTLQEYASLVESNLGEQGEGHLSGIRELSSDFENTVRESIEKLAEVKEEQLETVQKEINSSLDTVAQKSQEIFRKSYENFVSETRDVQSEFDEMRDRMSELEESSSKRLEKITSEMSEMKETLTEEVDGYLKFLKNSAKEMSQYFDDEMSAKVQSAGNDIVHLEEELASLRERSTEELERKISPLYTKLGNVEKSLLDSQKHLVEQWESESARVMKQFSEKETLFNQTAEKWETQFENMTRDARESVHKGSLEIEKKRNDILTSFESEITEKITHIENLSRDWSEVNERTLSDVVSGFKIKIQEREDAAFERLNQLSARFTEIRNDIQERHESIVDTLHTEKRKLEEELSLVGQKQLELFSEESDARLDLTRENLEEMATGVRQKMEDGSGLIMEDFHELKESISKVMSEFRSEQNEMVQGIDREVRRTGDEVTEVREAFDGLKKEVNLLERAEKGAENIRKTITELEQKLQLAESKNADLGEIYRRVDELKEVRLKLDSELMMISQKREKVDKLEEQLQLILNIREEIEEKGDSLQLLREKLDEVLSVQTSVDDHKEKLNEVLEEFVEQHKLVENVIDTIARQSEGADQLKDKITELEEGLARAGGKSDVLRETLTGMEDRLLSFQKNESEIEEVRAKFLEIEDLIEDIERRKQQIETLRKRFEELRHSMNHSVQSIEQIEHDAESKVKQLTDLINAVDSEGISPKKSISAGDKKDIVVRLGKMGWSADEIATTINMDLSAIQTILSTAVDH